MKKTMSLLLMSCMGLVGTYARAGSAREDSVARLQSSVDVLQAIMATPDKGIPQEVVSNAKCILVVPNLIKGASLLVASTGVPWLLAVRRMAGVPPHSFRGVVGVGDYRSESKAWTWSCWL